jgi:frataxin-like iron-binding protein CyaY
MASRLHIVGIGGTGHKILTSVIHLTACGAFKGKLGPNQISSIRVLTIDADDANGNLSHTRSALDAYNNFTKAINGPDFGMLNIEAVSPDLNLSLYDGERNSISSTFNIAKYDGYDEDKLIRFLYTDPEISTQFNQGFYGHTSIGTLVVRDFLNGHKIWKDFLSKINENDFVIVIGSIFGGTGASAVPVVLDELNKKKKNDVTFNLATLMLTPYFNTIDPNAKPGAEKKTDVLMPDSVNFHIKAKAALYYYHAQGQNKQTDALYIIGEPETNFSNEAYSRGSSKQRNKAHPVELFAATAILDFITESGRRKGGRIITADRCADSKGSYYTWKMIHRANQDLSAGIRQFLKIAIFYNKLLYGDIKYGNGTGMWQNFYSMLNEEIDDNKNLLYENLYTYFRLFTDWIYDLHKKSTHEIDQTTTKMKWIPDNRVKLFNINDKDLFNSASVTNGVISGFDELVYNESSKNQAAKLYNEISNKRPTGNAKNFHALFSKIFEIVKSLEKDKKTKNQSVQDNFQSVPYLSQENKADFQRLDADPNKLWTASDPDLLVNIANGLPNVWGDSFTKDDVSIPSPWSIFIINELTLKESRFAALNKDSYNQWCGLITLLALCNICLYDKHGLELRRLDFKMEDSKFMDTVRDTCLPNSFVFDDQKWTDCHIVTLNGTAIAFLSNNTIICPAYSFSAAIKTHLNKIAPSIVDENGKFLSPDNYFSDKSNSLNKKAKYALRLFLTELRAVITRVAANNTSPIVAVLQDKVNAFINDLGNTIVDNGITIPPNNKDEVKNVRGVFDLLSPISRDTNVELPFVLDETICAETVALLGLNICNISSSSKEAAHIFVTDSLLYNHIDPMKIQELSGKTLDNILLLNEGELLNDSLMLITKNNEDVFPVLAGSGSHPEYQIVWPISDKLLELYSVETLNKMLSFTVSQNTITVTLTLKTRGKFGNHVIPREYRIVDSGNISQGNSSGVAMVYDKNRMPFWAIWPFARLVDGDNTSGRDKNLWNLYNYFCVDPVYNGNAVFEIDPVFSDVESKKDGEKQLSPISTAINDVYYRRYNDIPVAFKINEKTGGKPKYRGTVFLIAPKPIKRGHLDWNIGLDFGTTSTTAFYSTNQDSTPRFIQLLSEYKWVDGSDEPEKAKLRSDICILCNSGDTRSNLDCENYFIDKQCLEQNGYTTTYEVLNNTRDVEHTIFTTGRIFWHNHENFKIVNTTPGRYEQIRTNIKWETDHSFAGKYLSQLMTQIVYHAAVNGAQKINWFFSYPTAFGLSNKSEFQSTLLSIIDSLKRKTGIEIEFDKKENVLTESIAAAYYFKKQNPSKQVFLCVDIGGGTSDVSIWIKTKYVFQSSIRFASRDMFVEPLKKLLERNSVMDVVRTNKQEDGIYTMLSRVGANSQISDDKIKFLIETVLFEYYSMFRRRLGSLEGKDDQTAYMNFKHYVLMAYSGLVYYIANIISELLLTENPKKKISNDISEIIFGLSGKGSRLTDWIDEYCEFIYEEAQNLIKMKTKSYDNNEGISVRLRNQFVKDTAKTETAIGMICNLDGGGRQRNQGEIINPDVYMGCAITMEKGGTEKEYHNNAFIDVYTDEFAEPQELVIKLDPNLTELDEFIEFFNGIAKKTRGDMPPISRDWFSKQKKQLWLDTTTVMENILQEKRFESPFIVLLNEFLKEYSERDNG